MMRGRMRDKMNDGRDGIQLLSGVKNPVSCPAALFFRQHIPAMSLVSHLLSLISYTLSLSGCDTVFTAAEGIPEFVTPEQPVVIPGQSRMLVRWTNIGTAVGWELWWANGRTGDRSNWKNAKPEDDFITDSETNTVRITMTGLTTGRPYYVWVKAVYKKGVSGFSDMSEEGVPLLMPDKPDGYAPPLTAGDEYFIAQWTPNGMHGPSQYYDIYYSKQSAAPADNDVSVTVSESASKLMNTRWVIVPGLTNGVKYHVWVRAKNTAGNSPWESLGEVSPAAAGAKPDAAQYIPGPEADMEAHNDAFTLTQANKRITVDWRPFTSPASTPADTSPDVSRYKVYYTTYGGAVTSWNDTHLIEAPQSAGEKYIPVSGSMSVTLTGLANQTQYYIYIRTGNSAGWSDRIHSKTNRTGIVPLPKAPPDWSDKRFTLCSAEEEFTNYEYGKGDRLARKDETAYSDLVGDALAWWARAQGYAADFAFYNGGLITDGLPKGYITISDVRGSLTQGARIAVVRIKGSSLRALFDYAADVLHDGTGSAATEAFPQVSGECRFTIDYTYGVLRRHGFIPWGVEGEVKISGVPIDNSKTYTIVTSRYLLAGGSGYGAYLYGDNEIKTTTEIWQAVAGYLWDITPPALRASNFKDGRIQLINPDWSGAE